MKILCLGLGLTVVILVYWIPPASCRGARGRGGGGSGDDDDSICKSVLL